MEAVLYGALALGGILVIVFIQSQFDKRKGAGYYTPYGPNSTRSERAHIDKANDQYRLGVNLFHAAVTRREIFVEQEQKKNARRAFEEAAALGHAGASTGLGLMEQHHGNSRAAREHWAKGSSRGDDGANVFLRLIDDDSPAYPFDRVMKLYLAANGMGDAATVRAYADIARSYGLYGYAHKLNERADRLPG